jgi:hypothetical protein
MVWAEMDFDIHALDTVDPGSDEADKAFDLYSRSLSDLFVKSPEGHALLQSYPDAGFWAARLLDFGFNYIGVALPNMTSRDVEEIVSEYFPRKISLRSSEEADAAIPELLAFWEFLGREFALEAAQPTLRCLRGIQASFRAMMNDPSKFGMAKSFFMMGQSAGFDMTNQDEMNAFTVHYNAGLSAEEDRGSAPAADSSSPRDGDPRVLKNRARSIRRKIKGAPRKKSKKKRR